MACQRQGSSFWTAQLVGVLLGICLALPGCENSGSSGGASSGTALSSSPQTPVSSPPSQPAANPVQPPANPAQPPNAPSALPSSNPVAVAGTSIEMDYGSTIDFYKRPFPCESRRRADGSVDIDNFPNPGNLFVDGMLNAADYDCNGFGLSSCIYLQTTARLKISSLPSLADSVTGSAPVFLIGVDSQSPDYLQRTPVEVEFHQDAGPFGAANLLSLLPLQGRPLREERLYAAVVMRQVEDELGQPLGVSLPMAQLAAGLQPAGMSSAAFSEYTTALDALQLAGVALDQIAGLAVFRTGQPSRRLQSLTQQVLSQPLPAPLSTPTHLADHNNFCVYRTTIKLPTYQAGIPPFLFGGGQWEFDLQGQAILQGEEEANLYLTVPHGTMPAAGFPGCVLIRTGMGDAVPLVDRGVHAQAGASGVPGTGPAREFATAGFMGISVDGPHGGLRNVTGLDEQLLMFNMANPTAMRENLRQSALELILLAEVLAGLSFPVSCPLVTIPGGGPASVDVGHLALFGHSMGATIAPLVLALQPRYGAVILSGAGGSWIENIMHKQSPLPVRQTAELILGYPGIGRQLYTHDPVLSLLQWAGESSDPQSYARYVTSEPLIGEPRHVLMLQGIIDTYILPPIANTTSLSMGLDLAGPALDVGHPGLSQFEPLADFMALGSSSPVALPVQGNKLGPVGQAYTAVVLQHPEDGIEDGHEVVFQTVMPKFQYRCFLHSFAQGVPWVPSPAQYPNGCP